jgi:lysozyme family protein
MASRRPSYRERWPVYAKMWDGMKVTRPSLEFTVTRILAKRSQYAPVAIVTGVPLAMIAAIHWRESGGDFTTYLGNGEPLNRVTELVPAGRGPWKSWGEGAIDALQYQGLHKVKDWRLEKVLYWWEDYNGWAYFFGPTDYKTGDKLPSMPSAYLWAGTNQYKQGKFVADRKFDQAAVDKQWGCVALLKGMMEMNQAIRDSEAFTRES